MLEIYFWMKTLGMGIEERQIRWLKFHRSEENFGFSGNAWCRRRSRRSDKEITSDRTPFTAIPPCYEGFLLRRSSGSSCHFSRLELPIELVTESRRPKASCRINEERFCRSPVPQKSQHPPPSHFDRTVKFLHLIPPSSFRVAPNFPRILLINFLCPLLCFWKNSRLVEGIDVTKFSFLSIFIFRAQSLKRWYLQSLEKGNNFDAEEEYIRIRDKMEGRYGKNNRLQGTDVMKFSFLFTDFYIPCSEFEKIFNLSKKENNFDAEEEYIRTSPGTKCLRRRIFTPCVSIPTSPLSFHDRITADQIRSSFLSV